LALPVVFFPNYSYSILPASLVDVKTSKLKICDNIQERTDWKKHFTSRELGEE
jgi:hypothetical protein